MARPLVLSETEIRFVKRLRELELERPLAELVACSEQEVALVKLWRELGPYVQARERWHAAVDRPLAEHVTDEVYLEIYAAGEGRLLILSDTPLARPRCEVSWDDLDRAATATATATGALAHRARSRWVRPVHDEADEP